MTPNVAELRFDKRHCPYIVCAWCQSRCFVRHRDGLTSLLALMPGLDTLLTSRESIDELRAQAHAAGDARDREHREQERERTHGGTR